MQLPLLLCVALVLRLAASAGAGPGDCSAAIREVRASMLAKIGALQKDLQDSLVFIKSELRALRATNEAGLLDLKNTVAAQSGARDMPLVPVKNSPVLKELANSILVNVARIRPILMAAHVKLRTDLKSDLRRLRGAVGAAKPVRATCAPAEQLLRRLGNATCAAAAKAFTGGLAGLARASGRLQARAQSLLRQQLGQQRRQLVVFERRQNATLSRMERALNCSKASVNNTTEITKIAEALDLRKSFRQMTTQEMADSWVGVGPQPLKRCAALCLVMGSQCRGFHSAPNQTCSLLAAAVESWKETERRRPLTLWVRRDVSRNPKCTSARFPAVSGRSRYRVERRRMSWTAAMRSCRSLGGKLAELSSDRERLLVYRLVNRAAGRPRNSAASFVNYHWQFGHHIGLYQTSKADEPRGNWAWYPSMDRLLLGNRWVATQPDNWKGKEERGVLLASNGLFNDVPTYYPFPSVCECFTV